MAKPSSQRKPTVKLKPGEKVCGPSSWLVRKSTTDWQDGSAVKVYVNPNNPAQATLEPRVPFIWLLWLCVAGFAAGAWYFARLG